MNILVNGCEHDKAMMSFIVRIMELEACDGTNKSEKLPSRLFQVQDMVFSLRKDSIQYLRDT